MLTPVQFGGFGTSDIFLMNKSLNLRSIGRMATTEHPMFKQIWLNLKYRGFFNVKTELMVDLKIKEGIKLLNEN